MVNILTPNEYKQLIEAIPKLKGRFQIETMLNTGMRYVELQRFSSHPEWFDAKNRMIVLPICSTKTGRSRDVHLTPQFSSRLELFLASSSLDFPARQAMNENLRRWIWKGINAKGYETWVTVKTFRKTWETWLLAVYQDRSLDIWMSQGHTGTVSMNHYYGSVGKIKSEMDMVREYVKGWGT